MKQIVAVALLLTLAVPSLAGAAGPLPAGIAAVPASALAKVDVNRASVAELEDVPGIGPRLAQAIVELRERRGTFTNLNDLLEVRGIGEKSLAVIAEHLTVVPAAAPAAAGKVSSAK